MGQFDHVFRICLGIPENHKSLWIGDVIHHRIVATVSGSTTLLWRNNKIGGSLGEDSCEDPTQVHHPLCPLPLGVGLLQTAGQGGVKVYTVSKAFSCVNEKWKENCIGLKWKMSVQFILSGNISYNILILTKNPLLTEIVDISSSNSIYDQIIGVFQHEVPV